MKIGFIGTGKITSSIIYGIFKSKLKISRIYISSRNRSIAKKLRKKFKSVKKNFEIVDNTLGYSLSEIILNGPDDKLKLTKNTQPAISSLDWRSNRQKSVS